MLANLAYASFPWKMPLKKTASSIAAKLAPMAIPVEKPAVNQPVAVARKTPNFWSFEFAAQNSPTDPLEAKLQALSPPI
uniref:Uncharacterized protein n=1 Tax=Desertifilum tharense IPPAS B-1220 TaxID=1781255 RepID=A0A1E5QI14_9CYAN|nr:hypothetical protein BH720_15080 [Desertifilum tharense IPPAS B-1220]